MRAHLNKCTRFHSTQKHPRNKRPHIYFRMFDLVADFVAAFSLTGFRCARDNRDKFWYGNCHDPIDELGVASATRSHRTGLLQREQVPGVVVRVGHRARLRQHGGLPALLRAGRLLRRLRLLVRVFFVFCRVFIFWLVCDCPRTWMAPTP